MALDPGVKGGLAMFYPAENSANNVQAFPIPEDKSEFRNLIANIVGANGEHWVCFMEQVGGYIGKEQPGSMMFVFGESYGMAQGLLMAFGVQIILVRPQIWQRGIPNRVGTYSERKRALKDYAQQRFPQIKVTAAIADALCILTYGVQFGHRSGLEDKQTRAIDWCKRAGFPVPVAGSTQFKKMFAYWCANIWEG